MIPSRTIDFIDAHGHALRVALASIAVLTAIFVACLGLSTIKVDDTPRAAAIATPASDSSGDGANIIDGGLTVVADSVKQSLDAASVALDNSSRTFEIKTVHGAQAVVQSGASVAHATQHGATVAVLSVGSAAKGLGKGAVYAGGFVVRSTGYALTSLTRTPGNILGIVPSMFSFVPSVSAAIRPADAATLPVIDPALSAALAPQTAGQALLVAQPVAAAAPAPAAAPKPDTTSYWPIHGAITTQFGVPELPYQAIHTGLDISDGNRPGITAVRAFRTGRVVQVIHSALGLGNHVVIDHGGGLTSVYGHMYSIAVQEGQQVNPTTILGTEGSTGVSTGTHLHFETRINGQAVNPHQFIPGQP